MIYLLHTFGYVMVALFMAAFLYRCAFVWYRNDNFQWETQERVAFVGLGIVGGIMWPAIAPCVALAYVVRWVSKLEVIKRLEK